MSTPLINLLSQPSIERLGWTLLHSVWQGGAIALLLALILRHLREAKHRHGACLAALMGTLICSVVTFRTMTVSAGSPAPATLTSSKDLTSASIPNPSDAKAAIVSAGKTMAQATDLNSLLQPCLPWLAGIWIFGVALLSLKQCFAWVHLRRWRNRHCHAASVELERVLSRLRERLRIRRLVRLMECTRASTPMLLGWLRPIIILPSSLVAGLSQEQLEAILTHELAHLSRGDALLLWFQRVMETLYFFHPGIRWISRRLQIEREHRCDDWAVAAGTPRETLAAALGRLALWNESSPASFTLAATGHRPVLERMLRLLQVPTKPARRTTWPFATLSSLAVVTAMIWVMTGWNHRLTAETPAPPHETTLYAASARLIIQWSADKTNPVPDPEARADFRATQIELLQSGELKRRTLERVRALHPELVGKGSTFSVHAARVKESSIFEVTCEAEDPKLAEVSTDALVDEYMAFRREMVEKTVGAAMNKVIEEVLNREKTVKQKAEQLYEMKRSASAEKKATDEFKDAYQFAQAEYKRNEEDYQEWKKTLDKLDSTLKLSSDPVSIIERPTEARKVGK